MTVLDHEEHTWFLLEEDGALILDANCNHSAVGYTWTIELNDFERQEYAARGRAYLDWLAHEIHYSAPIVAGNTSPYKSRNVAEQYGDKISASILTWRDAEKQDSV